MISMIPVILPELMPKWGMFITHHGSICHIQVHCICYAAKSKYSKLINLIYDDYYVKACDAANLFISHIIFILT